ncbi:MAG: hypothetical protein RLZZ381_3343 [Cyanobacteriota bacterium]|jgi:hypothetical protein
MTDNIRCYTLSIQVDLEQLTVSYKEADPTFMLDTSEDIKEAILNEFGWLDSSGVKVIEIEEIKK